MKYQIAKCFKKNLDRINNQKILAKVRKCIEAIGSLVWDESPLFEEDIQAWANGPVVQVLYSYHRGQFKVNKDTFADGNVDALTPNQKDSIDKVLEALQDKSGQWLSELTHMESPWKDARGDLKPTERGDNVIPLAAMHEYYSSL